MGGVGGLLLGRGKRGNGGFRGGKGLSLNCMFAIVVVGVEYSTGVNSLYVSW